MTTNLIALFPEPCFLIHTDGQILEVNDAAAKLLGCPAGTLKASNIFTLIENADGKFSDFLRLCSSTRALLPGAVLWKNGGKVIDCRCQGGLVNPPSAEQPGVMFLRCWPRNEALTRFTILNRQIEALSQEVLERRRAQEAMHHSEERYRTLVAATSSVVWSADPRGNFRSGQSAWEEFTGQAGAGDEKDWLDAVHEEDRPRARAHWSDSVATGGIFDIQVRVWEREANAYRRCQLRAVAIRSSEGTLREWMGTVTDIEQQKQFEDQLRQAQRLESLGVLAGGVAHDFNNLLVGILGNSSLALETISSNSPARQMLKDVVAASESAATLTRQLLAYAGKGRFLIEPSIYRILSGRSVV